MSSFRKVLVAARGEIAVRIIRALRERGITSVAVYSKADSTAMHVRLADYSVCIGEAGAAESYMNMNNIITAALNHDCQAIHPGYGFLSENAVFARLCEEHGLVFIGPKAETIALMGNKAEARMLMKRAGVPVISGSEQMFTDGEEALAEADRIGFPLMIKAALGGGGKGMRECHCREDFMNDFMIARREAINAFADERLYLEKLIISPRHIEVQILADQLGNIITIGERDCSVQRSHQKLIEESPCPLLDQETREKLYHYAFLAAKAADYHNAGTAEFLVDQDRNCYFLEMNTRIQVEHGVSEMAADIDIVAEQIRIAEGNRLSFSQEDIVLRGHTIECRINAEIPEKGFIPSPGTVVHLHLPGGSGVRTDTALYTGCMIPSEYDSLIAKIIVHGKDRETAIGKMLTALEETVIAGIETNLDFQYKIVGSEAFAAGTADAEYIREFTYGGSHEDRS